MIAEVSGPADEIQKAFSQVEGVGKVESELDNGWLSMVTRHELHFGLALLPPSRRRDQLAAALDGLLSTYADRVLPILEAEADEAAHARIIGP